MITTMIVTMIVSMIVSMMVYMMVYMIPNSGVQLADNKNSTFLSQVGREN